MTDSKHSDDVQQKLSLLDKIISIFRKGHAGHADSAAERDLQHLEPKYWPEVVEFVDELNAVIHAHTVDDPNIHRVNQRIVDYVLEQINQKGQVEDIEQRYSALKTLTDRILSHHLNKLVGLKATPHSRTEFSDAVHLLQQKLEIRRQQDKKSNHQNHTQASTNINA